MILIKWFFFSFFLITLGWRPWASWSSCSAECEGGHQTRRRLCVRDVPNACEGDAKQKRQCNLFDCGGTIWFDLIWFDMTSMIRAICLCEEVHFSTVLIFILIRSNLNGFVFEYKRQCNYSLKYACIVLYGLIWLWLIKIGSTLSLIWFYLIEFWSERSDREVLSPVQ